MNKPTDKSVLSVGIDKFGGDLNNIIIYLNSEREHKEHIKWVLNRLYKKNIPVAVKKYKFHTKKTDFIGFIIKLKQISIDLKKLKLFKIGKT